MKSSDPPTRGRPRQFDPDAALDRAMRLFWARGFDATTIGDLAEAMAINPPSLYAAFGDKRRLFAAALARYEALHGAFVAAALEEEATAEDAVRRMLAEAAHNYARDDQPRGCLVVTGAATCASAAAEVAADLAGRRAAQLAAIRARFDRARLDRELDDCADPDALALWIVATIYGLSVAARDGATEEALSAAAAQAMLGWPGRARQCAAAPM